MAALKKYSAKKKYDVSGTEDDLRRLIESLKSGNKKEMADEAAEPANEDKFEHIERERQENAKLAAMLRKIRSK